ncbi:MAG TPA: hypothetical protein VF595_01770 [Tepidisphaeraceae bacterium]|jgi:hypothetical protein
MSRYADWKAPKQDYASLVWPDPPRLITDMAVNRAALDAAPVEIQNVPLRQWREVTRRSLIGDPAAAVIATGHQIELSHPGVWVKDVLLDAVARKTGATALHVAVDTDSPKHLQLRWPGGAIDLSDDVLLKTGEWSGQVAQPTPPHLQRIRERFDQAAAGWSFRPAIAIAFESLSRLNNSSDMLPAALSRAAHAVDESLGVHYQVRLLSSIVTEPAYLAFVHHIAADVERFATTYNAALADYRREAGITTPTRPMPDLRVDEDTIELPFWFDRLDTGDRSRATVIRDNGRWHLLTDAAAFVFDPATPGEEAAERFGAFCRQHQIRLTPRALTLTAFLRLIIADQFVHGIGGGRYDQVTDRLIENYFRVPAPTFAVTTATLFFPDAGERDAECVPCLLNEGHRLRHNTVTKQPYLDRIAAAPRRSTDRRTAYVAMHNVLQKESAISTSLMEWREKLDHAVRRRDHEAVLFDRELFYAVQPRERLERLIKTYRTAVGV